MNSTTTMLSIAVCLSTGIGLCPDLSGQGVSGELRTLTPLSVFAMQGARVAFKTKPAGQSLKPTSMSVSAQLGNAFYATLVNWNKWRTGIITVDFSQQGGANVSRGGATQTIGTSASPTARTFRPGPHALILRLKGRVGTRGLIELWTSGGPGNTAQITGGHSVDIGNDGSVEFRAPAIGFQSKNLTVRIPASGVLLVKLETVVKGTQRGPGGFRFKSGLSLRFTPAPLCVGRSYGLSCGPRLSGASVKAGKNHVFTVKFARGTPRAAGLLVIGTRQLDVPVPGVMCSLLTDPRIVVPFRATGQGTAQWVTRFPQSQTVNVRLQTVDLGGRVPRASNGLHVVCMQ